MREATLADIPTIRAIAQATWHVVYENIISEGQIEYMLDLMYSEAALHEQMVNKGHRFLMLEIAGSAVGYAGLEHRYAGMHRSRLHKLYVLPETQGTGAGRALLEAVLAEVRTAGDRSIELNVNRFNRSTDFYRHMGFMVERDEVLDIGHGYVMDDHVMVKHL
ncbi:MAG: GNAT family N-acetyltransferase [Flavobacteriales bacterium]